MQFLEKDLEAIIWESPVECEARGLDILQMQVFDKGRRYRQMQLGPYGIADLINIYYNPFGKTVWVQVIECKRGKVNGETYLQAKRYAVAVQSLLFETDFIGCTVYLSTVLVGDSVDTTGPLAYAIAEDPHCHTYTYSYAVDGIRFRNAKPMWRAETYREFPDSIHATARDLNQYERQEREMAAGFVAHHGDHASPLLIGATGVLLNTDLLAQ